MKLKPVLLPTKDKSPVVVGVKVQRYNPRMILTKDADAEWLKFGTYNNIYLIDEEAEIKSRDWYYFTKSGIHINLGTLPLNKTKWDGDKCFKIIASTDFLILSTKYSDENSVVIEYLPNLSKKSIKLLIDYYNKNGRLPESVEVGTTFGGEYLAGMSGSNEIWASYPDKIKLNSQGTIDISIPKDRMYTKGEVISKIHEAVKAYNYERLNDGSLDLDDWIKENLK